MEKSKTVPGFKPVPTENLGRNAFVGTVTQGGETHIGLGALHDTLIVGATLAGYNLTPENTAKLISLTHEEETRCQRRDGSKPTEIVAPVFKYIFYIVRHSRCFHLRKMKSRSYPTTRVQLDHARQRERGKQRVNRHRALQDSR